MPIVNLSFPFELNVSIQPTDQIYITLTRQNQAGRNHITNIDTKPFPWGNVTAVNFDTNTVTVDTWYPLGTFNVLEYYMFFQKDNRANSSGVLGYYAQVEYRNYSTLPAEMFATATNYSVSSK